METAIKKRLHINSIKSGSELQLNLSYWDGWMTCNFTSFLTAFQSYQDDGRLIMKGCAMELRLWLRRFRLERGSNWVR